MKFLRAQDILINVNNISDIFIGEDNNKFAILIEYKKYDYHKNNKCFDMKIYAEFNSKEKALEKLDELEKLLNN